MEKSNKNTEDLLLKKVELIIEKNHSKIFTQIWGVFGVFLALLVISLGYQFYQAYNYQEAMKSNLREVEDIRESVRIASEPVLETWKNVNEAEQIIRNLLTASTDYVRGQIFFDDSDATSMKRSLIAFENTIDKAPYWPLGYHMKSYTLMCLGRYDESIEIANKALGIVGIDDDTLRELEYLKAFSLLKRGLKKDNKNANGIFENLLREKKRDRVELKIYAVINMENEMILLLKELIEKEKIDSFEIRNSPEFKPFLNQQKIKDILNKK